MLAPSTVPWKVAAPPPVVMARPAGLAISASPWMLSAPPSVVTLSAPVPKYTSPPTSVLTPLMFMRAPVPKLSEPPAVPMFAYTIVMPLPSRTPLSLSASSSTFSTALFCARMGCLTMMELAARSVKVAGGPKVFWTSALTVMSPISVPLLPVVMVTLLPDSSALLMSTTLTLEPVPMGVMVSVPPEELVLMLAFRLLTMVTS